MLEGILIVLAVFAVSAAIMFWAWHDLFAWTEGPTTHISLTPMEFVECLRAESPASVDVAILHSVSRKESYVRFRYRTVGAGHTFHETIVTNLSDWQYAEPHRQDLYRLYQNVRWINYCTEYCGWCGFCMHNFVHEGRVKEPCKVIQSPAKAIINKAFLPPV